MLRAAPIPAVMLAAALLACASVPAAREARRADAGTTWAEAREGRAAAVRVLYVPAPGFAYRDRSGRLTGVTVETMREFARWMHQVRGVQLELEFVEEADWRRFYDRVRAAQGGVFGVGNVTITEARRAELRFSPPYLTNVAVLITHERVPELRRMQDAATAFRGLDALAYAGTLHETRLRSLRDQHLPAARVVVANSNQEILDRVAQGRHFAYIDAYNYWRAREAGAPLRHHPVADDPAEEFGIIMPRGTDWGPLVDAFFRADGGYRNTPRYRHLLVQHLGEPLTRMLQAARLAASPQDAFWRNLLQQCGNAYAGRLVVARPERMPLTGEEGMIAHFRECGADTLRVPFHIESLDEGDWDRSRTWMFMRTADGLELRHDHRHEDGTEEDDNFYGGHTHAPGTANQQEFVFEERVDDDGSILGWRIEVFPGQRYTYGTIRGEAWTWRVDFDLTRTVPAPPPAWGPE